MNETEEQAEKTEEQIEAEREMLENQIKKALGFGPLDS